jgi:zinc protease
VAALGGRENAFTSRDYTGYYQQIPAGKLADVMQLEADRFAHNQWPDEEFSKELEVVKEERRLRTDDNPRSLLNEQLNAAVFVASPYRRPIVGWMSDLEALTPADAREFYRAGMCPPTPPWWWPVMWTWQRCVPWQRSTTAASACARRARAQAAHRARAGRHPPH